MVKCVSALKQIKERHKLFEQNMMNKYMENEIKQMSILTQKRKNKKN